MAKSQRRSQNKAPKVPMSDRFEFFFSNRNCYSSCICSENGPWLFSSNNDQRPVRRRKYKTSNSKKAKPKINARIAEDSKGESVLEYLTRATSRSSFIGLNRIASSKTLYAKLIWGVLTLICLTGFMFQALKFALLYHSLPTEVILTVENNGVVNFPAVTICNHNRIKKSNYCSHYPKVCNETPRLILSESEIMDAYLVALEDGVPNYKSHLGHSMQMIKGCMFKGINHLNVTECLKLFIPIFDPDFGNCFTFPAKDSNGNYLTATEADFWDTTNDFMLLLDKEEEDYTERKRQPGLIIAVHSSNYSADIHTDAIEVEGGSSYTFAVQQSVSMLLPLPFETNCTNFHSLPWVNVDEIPSSRICTVGCSRHFQLKDCGYVTRTLSLFYDELPWDHFAVTEDQKQCAAEVEEATKTYCRSLCAVSCEDVQFDVAVSETGLLKTEVADFYSNEDDVGPEWKNLTIVRVYYKTIERKLYEHIAMYDDIELFSYLGGYSGVWLGFSLLNLFELLEIAIIATYSWYKTRKKNKESRKKFRTTTQNLAFQDDAYTNSFHKATKVKIVKRQKCCGC